MASGVSGATPSSPRGFAAEVRDAVSMRAALLVTAVLLLQLGFVLSYVGALHHPRPDRASIAVVAPAQIAGNAAQQIDALPGRPLKARTLPDEAAARSEIRGQKLYSALVLNPSGSQDRLLVAGAAGPSLARTIEQIITQAEASQHRTVAVVDVVPVATGDSSGLTSFYLAIGWCVGGYLVASILGISAGARPATRHRAVIRLGSLALYSIASGIGGAIVVGPGLHAIPAGMLALWGVGALLVFAVGAFTMALQCFFGVVGIGIAVLIFVILGNPSAGGVLPPPMTPPFWRAIGPWIPNGAGTSLNRSYSYFNGTHTTGPWVVLAVWAIVGVVATLIASSLRAEATAGRNRSM